MTGRPSTRIRSSEHAEHDRSQEGKGYDGRKHIEPCPQFHLASMPDQADVDAKLPRAKNANLGGRQPDCQACFDAAMRYFAGKFQVTRDQPALVRNNHAGVRLL